MSGLGFADRGRVVRALHAVRADEVAGDQPRLQSDGCELARPMMRAAAGLHRYYNPWRQLRTPCREPISGQRLGNHHATGTVYGMNLDHALGQIHPHSNNLASCICSMDFPFPASDR